MSLRTGFRIGRVIALLAALFVLSGCSVCKCGRTNLDHERWADSTQLVLVTSATWDADHGTLQRYAREHGKWTPVGAPWPVALGRSGSAWGVGLHDAQGEPHKREGDGRSPAGVFPIGMAFGYADRADTALSYSAMTADDWCVDVDGSPLYNQIVDAKDVGADAVHGSSEPMRRDLHADGDQRYKLGFVIRHNRHGFAHEGSCIFAHLWKTPESTTAGCTAMDEDAMRALLAWLRDDAHPIFVLLPADEIARHRADWELP